MERKWKPNQLRAIECTAARTLVSASAGSGKTSVVTERIVRLVRGGADLSRILAVTFTNAAAAEMKARIFEQLESDPDPAVRAQRHGFTQIGTMHALCADLIRAHFFRAGLDPAFEVADETQAESYRARAAAAVVERYTDDCDADFAALSDALSVARGDAVLAQIFGKASARRLSGGAPLNDNNETDINNGGVTLVSGGGENVRTAPALPTETETVTETASDTPLADKLREAAAGFDAEYARQKAEDGRLDFDDLELYAERLLTDPDVLHAVHRKYSHVFVDEYQDVNPIQHRIITAVTGGAPLFVVGDAKQCIYAFRGCDPRIFADAFARVKAGGAADEAAVELNDNFRSDARILRFCDDVFAALMRPAVCGIDYDKGARFTPALDFPPPPLPPVAAFLITKSDAEKPSGYPDVYSAADAEPAPPLPTAERAEALIIAREIERTLLSPLYDPKTGAMRQAKFSDVAVLVRKHRAAHIRALTAAFTAAGIPFVSELPASGGGSGFMRNLADLLRVIDNFRQDVPLTAVMRGAFFNFTDNECAAVRAAFPSAKYYHEAALSYAETAQTPLGSRIRDMFGELNRYRAYSAGKTAVELLDIILQERDAYVLAAEEGADTLKRLETLVRNLRGGSQGETLYDMVAYLNGGEESGGGTRGAAEAVLITNIHKSKGAEFPVVFLAGVGMTFRNPSSDGFIVGRNGELAVQRDGDEDGSEFARLTAAAKRAGTEEELRLLYVALTRAQNRLILTGVAQKEPDTAAITDDPLTATSFADWLLTVNSPLCPVYKLSADEVTGGTDEDLNTAEIAITKTADISDGGIKPDNNYADDADAERERAVISAAAAFQYPHAAACRMPVKQSATGINALTAPAVDYSEFESEYRITGDNNFYGTDNDTTVFFGADADTTVFFGTDADEVAAETISPAQSSPAAISPADRGNAYHTVMRFIAPDTRGTDGARAEINRLVTEGLLTERLADAVAPGKIAAALASPLWTRARAAAHTYREQTFLFLSSAFNGVIKNGLENGENKIKNNAENSAETAAVGKDDNKTLPENTANGVADELLIQGTIDLLFEENGALVAADYKLSALKDDALRAAYAAQLSVYAAAASEILGLPVKEKIIYSFNGNRIISV